MRGIPAKRPVLGSVPTGSRTAPLVEHVFRQTARTPTLSQWVPAQDFLLKSYLPSRELSSHLGSRSFRALKRHPTTGSTCVEHSPPVISCDLARRRCSLKVKTLRAQKGLYATCRRAKAKPTRRRAPWPSPLDPQRGVRALKTSG